MKQSHFVFWKGKIALVVLLILTFASCKDKEEIPKTFENGVFIVNEGNFQGGNASLSFLHQPGDSVDQQIFANANARPLGDVAQSMQILDNKGYIVVNNSGKIEVVNFPELDEVCTITGMVSPRYMHFISANKAYVSDLYSNSISIVDPENCSVTGSISVNSWTEEMAEADGSIWVTQAGTDQLLMIDPQTDQIIDSIFVGREPVSIVKDAFAQLWVLCTGGLNTGNARIVEVNPTFRAANAAFLWTDPMRNPSRLCINPAGDRLYWLDEGAVYSMGTGAFSTPTELIPAGNGNLYGLEVDPETGNLYLLNARDYVQAGELLRYSATGQLIDAYPTGVIPSTVAFY